ncbi:MAG TPA: glycosyltransferase family 2 protein [Chloroflexota bacterium]
MSLPSITGISMVRNEVDIIRTTLLYHLGSGVDRIMVLDNGSTDGTDRVLETMSRADPRIVWERDDMPFLQADVFTNLARRALQEGADWVLPFDADEFWYAPRGLKRVLADTSAVMLRVKLTNFIQRREQAETRPRGLLTMTRRTAEPVGPLEATFELTTSRKIAHVEAMHPPKWIFRPTSTVQVSHGNHFVTGLVGGVEDTDEIVCCHAALRSRARMESKGLHGRRVEETKERPGESWHVRRFRRLQQEGRLDEEWAANSYRDNTLDVFGTTHPVVYDPTLRTLVMPYLARTPWGRYAASLRKKALDRKAVAKP